MVDLLKMKIVVIFFGKLFFLSLLIPLYTLSEGSEQEEIRKHRQQLETIRQEIAEMEQKIQQTRESERESLSLLENLDRQTVTVRTFIRTLREEEHRLIREIDEARRNIQTLQNEISQLRTHYAGYVSSVYKRGIIRDVQLLLTSSSFNQLLVRTEYLRRFSEQRRKDLRSISEKQLELQKEEERLSNALVDQRRVLQEKQQEEKRLTDRTVERRNVLNTIRRQRSTYETELERKRVAEQELRRLIADLIERERIRRERDAQRMREGMPTEIIPPGVPFADLKGKLPWPVRDGQIASRFGEQVHPVLKTVTQNTGIDIEVPPGSPVYTVAEGEVVIIRWLPSYGNLVIIYHFEGYRSVYANLSEILVTEGDRVFAGDMIARSGESLKGSVIHFEIWKDREKQNPETWLSVSK